MKTVGTMQESKEVGKEPSTQALLFYPYVVCLSRSSPVCIDTVKWFVSF